MKKIMIIPLFLVFQACQTKNFPSPSAPNPSASTKPRPVPIASAKPSPTPVTTATSMPSPEPSPLGPVMVPIPSLTLWPGVCQPSCVSTRVSGTLVDHNGQALAGARVTISSLVKDQPYQQTVITDAQGNYGLDNAPAEIYLNLKAEKAGYSLQERRLVLRHLSPEGTEANRIHITLIKPMDELGRQNCLVSCTIFGTLDGTLFAEGVRLGSHSIELRSLSAAIPYRSTIQSNIQGEFHFDQAPGATPLSLTVQVPGYETYVQELVLKDRQKGDERVDIHLVPAS